MAKSEKYHPRMYFSYLECSRFDLLSLVDKGAARSIMSNIIIMVLHDCVFTAHTTCYCQVVDCTLAGGACNLDTIAKS